MIMDNKELEKYLVEIGKTPLLSIEEEIELAKAVQRKGTDCDEMKRLHEVYDRFFETIKKNFQYTANCLTQVANS